MPASQADRSSPGSRRFRASDDAQCPNALKCGGLIHVAASRLINLDPSRQAGDPLFEIRHSRIPLVQLLSYINLPPHNSLADLSSLPLDGFEFPLFQVGTETGNNLVHTIRESIHDKQVGEKRGKSGFVSQSAF